MSFDLYPHLAAIRDRAGVASQEYHDAFMAAAYTAQGTAWPDLRTVYADERACANCGSAFRPTAYQVKIGGGWCCSARCYGRLRFRQ